MTLFAALTAKEDGASASGPSSSSPPEAIQLHADRAIDFLNGTTVDLSSAGSKPGGEATTSAEGGESANANNDGGRSRHFSALSYQAVQTQQDDVPATNKSAGAGQSRHLRPDLGVWDCRMNEASATLLKRVVVNRRKKAEKSTVDSSSGEEKKGEEDDSPAAAPKSDASISDAQLPIVMAVDMSDPVEVQPVIERMRNGLLEVYEKEKAVSSNNPHACTTSIKSLQNSVFGKALIQEEVKGGPSSSGQKISLILAVIVPPKISTAASTSAADEYRERQARALLLYHLHKFSLEVDCTLCFVGDGSDAGEEGEAKGDKGDNDPLLGRNTTMSIEELGKVVRRVATGLPPVELSELDQPIEEGKEGSDEPPRRPPSIHAPGSHDAELISGAYLRNASCEGRWDASKDDLGTALPPRSAQAEAPGKAKDESKNEGKPGDEDWLSQLASSIGLSPDAASTSVGEAVTPSATERRKKDKPAVKKRVPRASTRGKDSKPKDEKEVMNFFDNLLKK